MGEAISLVRMKKGDSLHEIKNIVPQVQLHQYVNKLVVMKNVIPTSVNM